MANEKYRLIHKRSNQLVSGQPKAPASGMLEKGELAINYNNADPCLFIEKDNGDIAKFSSSQVITDFVDGQISDAIATETARTESTYLKSFTETDPVFTASAAHNITSSDIVNWNGKADSAHTHGGSQVIYDGTLIPEFAGKNMTEGVEYLTAYKQDTLVSGENIKTINGYNILGSGNIYIQGGGGGGDYFPGEGIDINQASHTISVAPTIAGSTTVSSVSNIPVTHRAVLATVSANGTLSFATLPQDGYEVHVIIRNSGSSVINITLPSSGNYVCTSENVIYIAGGKYGEVNIVTIGSMGYVHGISSI